MSHIKTFNHKTYHYVSTAHSPGAAEHAIEEQRRMGYYARRVVREGISRDGIGHYYVDIYRRKK